MRIVRSRISAELELLAGAQRCQLRGRQPEIDLDWPPPGPGELLQQLLLLGRRGVRARHRLIGGEIEVRTVAVDLLLQRDQRRIPIPIPQLLLQELAFQVLN